MALPLPVASFRTTLTNKVVTADTEILIDSITDDDGNSMNGLLVAMVINKGASNEETVMGTVDGPNKKLTSVTRGISVRDGLTSVSALIPATHGKKSPIEFTAHPFLVRLVRIINGTDQIPALLQYNSSFTPVDGKDVPTKDYVDSLVLATSVSRVAVVIPGTGGEALVAGNAVYWDPADQEWKKTDATDAAKSSNALQLGIAQGVGIDGGAIDGGVLVYGWDETLSGLTPGDTLYLSDTPGALANSAGTIEVAVADVDSATQIIFDAREINTPTASEKDALVGTSGTPGSGNLYVTELGLQRSIETYAVDSVGTDTYAITLDPVPTGYVAGMTIRVKFGTLNTGAATINVNSLGAKAITKSGAVPLATGDILANQVAILVYDGTQFQIQSQSVQNLKDGSNADDLHAHDPAVPAGKRLYFVGSAGDGAAETTSGVGAVTRNVTYSVLSDTGFAATSSLVYDLYGTGSQVDWDVNHDLVFAFKVNEVQSDYDITAGFCDTIITNNTYITEHAAFSIQDGTLIASIADDTTQETATISGITLGNWNVYRIKYTPTSVEFYVNGTLEATLNTNLPAGIGRAPIIGLRHSAGVGNQSLHVANAVRLWSDVS